MIFQLLVGSLVIPITILIQVVFIQIAISRLRQHRDFFLNKRETIRGVVVLSAATLWLLAALSLAIWMWALLFKLLQCFPTLEEALYFSMVAFTTLGFGDVTLPQDWRILSGMIAANGLVLFGLNTAFLIECLRRILSGGERP